MSARPGRVRLLARTAGPDPGLLAVVDDHLLRLRARPETLDAAGLGPVHLDRPGESRRDLAALVARLETVEHTPLHSLTAAAVRRGAGRVHLDLRVDGRRRRVPLDPRVWSMRRPLLRRLTTAADLPVAARDVGRNTACFAVLLIGTGAVVAAVRPGWAALPLVLAAWTCGRLDPVRPLAAGLACAVGAAALAAAGEPAGAALALPALVGFALHALHRDRRDRRESAAWSAADDPQPARTAAVAGAVAAGGAVLLRFGPAHLDSMGAALDRAGLGTLPADLVAAVACAALGAAAAALFAGRGAAHWASVAATLGTAALVVAHAGS